MRVFAMRQYMAPLNECLEAGSKPDHVLSTEWKKMDKQHSFFQYRIDRQARACFQYKLEKRDWFAQKSWLADRQLTARCHYIVLECPLTNDWYKQWDQLKRWCSDNNLPLDISRYTVAGIVRLTGQLSFPLECFDFEHMTQDIVSNAAISGIELHSYPWHQSIPARPGAKAPPLVDSSPWIDSDAEYRKALVYRWTGLRGVADPFKEAIPMHLLEEYASLFWNIMPLEDLKDILRWLVLGVPHLDDFKLAYIVAGNVARYPEDQANALLEDLRRCIAREKMRRIIKKKVALFPVYKRIHTYEGAEKSYWTEYYHKELAKALYR